MILLIRFFLISIIVYLIVRAFSQFGNIEENQEQNAKTPKNNIKDDKKISKEIGEYVDYEEIDKKNKSTY